MATKRKLLSYLNSGPLKSDWFSGIRIPRETSSHELSYTAQCVQVLRPLFPLLGAILLIYTSLLLVRNWPPANLQGIVWFATGLMLSLPLLLGGTRLSRRLRANQISTARILCLGAALNGILLGSAAAVFATPLSIAATLGCVMIGMVIFAAFPLSQMIFAASFALAELMLGADALPPVVVAFCLAFSFAAIWASSHVRYLRSSTRMDLQNERISRMSEQRGSFVWETDMDGCLLRASEGLFKVLGRPAAEIVGDQIWALTGADAAVSQRQEREIAFGTDILRRHHLMQAPFGDLTICARARDGIHSLALSGQPRYDAMGNFVGFMGIGLDLTEFTRVQDKLLASAERDALTRLMNRACFNERLEEMLSGKQDGRCATALLLIDLDKFKQANDTLGHQVGDQVLRQFSERLKMFIHNSGFVGRLGGDEFGVVLNEISDRRRLEALACELVRYLSAPYEISGLKVTIGAAIGIAIGPEHGDTVDSLVRNADLALYSAKARGGNCHRVFDTTLLEHALERRQLEIDLGKAIEKGELSLQYQAIVDSASERLAGFEALVHWHHPVRGEVAADEFIPLAETAGLINRLGEWVMREACAEAAQWPSHVRLAVNLSPTQFVSPGLTTVVVNSLAQSRLPPGRLEIEITENVFLDEAESTQAILRQLHDLGVRWTLDDFGTGYSSLKYLLKAPFSKIKIDREFVSGLSAPGSQKRPIVATIVALAQNLGMETTAEGVESYNDLKAVRELGCTQVQGFVYGPKLHAREARALARSRLPIATEGYEVTRREQRMVVLRSADVTYRGEKLHGTVRNVSSSGAMMEAEWQASVGSRVEIHMDHDKPRAGMVRWVDGFRFGVQFDEYGCDPVSMREEQTFLPLASSLRAVG